MKIAYKFVKQVVYGSIGAGYNTNRRRSKDAKSPASGPFYGGKDCDGKRKEVQNCNVIKCPIDGTWEPWGKWSDCSKTCAGNDDKLTIIFR